MGLISSGHCYSPKEVITMPKNRTLSRQDRIIILWLNLTLAGLFFLFAHFILVALATGRATSVALIHRQLPPRSLMKIEPLSACRQSVIAPGAGFQNQLESPELVIVKINKAVIMLL
jgi:hypothetical protein